MVYRHNLIRVLPARANNVCTEFQLATAQKEPPTDYKIDRMAKYECFMSGGFSETRRDWHGVHVGNTTVNCNVTWVLSWFPHGLKIPVQ